MLNFPHHKEIKYIKIEVFLPTAYWLGMVDKLMLDLSGDGRERGGK